MLDQKQIEAKLADLIKARDQFIAQAEKQLLALNNQIAALQSVLAEPKESNVSEFKKPEVVNVEV